MDSLVRLMNNMQDLDAKEDDSIRPVSICVPNGHEPRSVTAWWHLFWRARDFLTTHGHLNAWPPDKHLHDWMCHNRNEYHRLPVAQRSFFRLLLEYEQKMKAAP